MAVQGSRQRGASATDAGLRRVLGPPHGATAVLVAICLVMLIGFLALALNVGHLFSVRGELQNAADSGALAGAMELDGSNAKGELASALATGADYAARHFTDTATGVVAESVDLGNWGPSTAVPVCDQRGDASADGYRFCRIDPSAAGAPIMINAVRVVTARTGDASAPGGGGVELFASGVIAPTSTDGRSTVRTAAVAVTGGPCSQDCPKLPIVIRAGCLKNDGALRCGATYYVGLSSAIKDTAGQSGLETGPTSSNLPSTNSPSVCAVVKPGSCLPFTSPAWATTSNGNNLTANCMPGCTYNGGQNVWTSTSNATTCEAIRAQLDANCDGALDAPLGTVKTQVPVVVYPGEDENSCPDGAQYNGPAQIVGVATVTLVSARCESKSPSSDVSKICDDAMLGYAGSQCLAFQLLCEQKDDEDTTVGCGWFGTSPLRPVLVR